MFKRVDKRRRKQEEEEELGLDENTREILGLNDTDSEESDSDSDDSDDSEAVAAEDGADDDAGEEADEGEDSSDDEEDAEEPPISVQEALRDPIYVVSIEPDVKACITCPGKLLKNAEILKLHRASKAHERRWKQFSEFAKSSKAAPDSNAWDVLKQRAEEKPKLSLTEGSTVSKRNKKREEVRVAFVFRLTKFIS
ncbi:hypothetical protein K438DRAFT_1816652 [Mycena galopus ATCC 62051]|nr:hypothetical protein K438DRAFT_1816652 [Mycena galopus ATCC 62051]